MKYLIALAAALAIVGTIEDPVHDAQMAASYYCDEDPTWTGDCELDAAVAAQDDCITDSCVEGIE